MWPKEKAILKKKPAVQQNINKKIKAERPLMPLRAAPEPLTNNEILGHILNEQISQQYNEYMEMISSLREIENELNISQEINKRLSLAYGYTKKLIEEYQSGSKAGCFLSEEDEAKIRSIISPLNLNELNAIPPKELRTSNINFESISNEEELEGAKLYLTYLDSEVEYLIGIQAKKENVEEESTQLRMLIENNLIILTERKEINQRDTFSPFCLEI